MKTVIEMAREADRLTDEKLQCPGEFHPDYGTVWNETFAALVREDEREKQQEPVAYMHTLEGDVQINNLPAECYGDHWKREPLYTTPPTAALAAKQMRDAAVKVCLPQDKWDDPLTAYNIAQAIAALPVPEVQWRDLTDDEILGCLLKWRQGEYELQIASAVIAKFKEKQL